VEDPCHDCSGKGSDNWSNVVEPCLTVKVGKDRCTESPEWIKTCTGQWVECERGRAVYESNKDDARLPLLGDSKYEYAHAQCVSSKELDQESSGDRHRTNRGYGGSKSQCEAVGYGNCCKDVANELRNKVREHV